MTGGLRDELRAEYTILQTHYEAYDARALLIKSWSAPLLAAGVGLGAERSDALFLLSLLAAVCLWGLEGFWKIYQRAFDRRIETLEAWFADPDAAAIAPFQILASWRGSFHASKAGGAMASDLLRILLKPAVCIPYLPIAAAGCALFAAQKLGWSTLS